MIYYVAVDDDGLREESVKPRDHLDAFDEVYRTHELTDFDKLLSRSVTRTGE